MKIKIEEKNEAKIEAALEKVQGRCKERTINVDEIYSYADKFIDHLDAVGIKIKYRPGARIKVDCCARSFPNSYRWTPESTHFTLTYCPSGIFLTNIFRERCTPRSFLISYTPKQKDAILQKMRKTLFG